MVCLFLVVVRFFVGCCVLCIDLCVFVRCVSSLFVFVVCCLLYVACCVVYVLSALYEA